MYRFCLEFFSLSFPLKPHSQWAHYFIAWISYLIPAAAYSQSALGWNISELQFQLVSHVSVRSQNLFFFLSEGRLCENLLVKVLFKILCYLKHWTMMDFFFLKTFFFSWKLFFCWKLCMRLYTECIWPPIRTKTVNVNKIFTAIHCILCCGHTKWGKSL